MDVIINNPPAAQTYQTQAVPYGYGPQPYGYRDHHGPGFLLPLLLILGAVFFAKRRRMMRRYMLSNGTQAGPDFDQMREKFRRGRDQFFNDGALTIARERYAKGEINADEYETLRRNLGAEGGQKGESYRPTADEGDLKV